MEIELPTISIKYINASCAIVWSRTATWNLLLCGALPYQYSFTINLDLFIDTNKRSNEPSGAIDCNDTMYARLATTIYFHK